MDLSKFFSSSYLFASVPPHDNKYWLQQLIIFGALIVVSIFYLLMKKMDIKVRYRHFYCFLTAGLLGFIYLGSRYEGLPWLGSRLFLALVLLMLVIWTIINTIWMMKYGQKLQTKKVLADRYEKYLPKKKK